MLVILFALIGHIGDIDHVGRHIGDIDHVGHIISIGHIGSIGCIGYMVLLAEPSDNY